MVSSSRTTEAAMPIVETLGLVVSSIPCLIDRFPEVFLEFEYVLHGPPIR